MADTTTITVRLDRAVRDRLENLARSTRRSKSVLAAEAINAYVDVNAWQIEGIENALADRAAGEVGVTHEQVKDWVRSWDTEQERPEPYDPTAHS